MGLRSFEKQGRKVTIVIDLDGRIEESIRSVFRGNVRNALGCIVIAAAASVVLVINTSVAVGIWSLATAFTCAVGMLKLGVHYGRLQRGGDSIEMLPAAAILLAKKIIDNPEITTEEVADIADQLIEREKLRDQKNGG